MTMPEPLTPLQEAIYKHVRMLAERGKRCPSDKSLADRFDCTAGASSSVFYSLRRKGLIEIEKTGHCRVITIVSTGDRTAPDEGVQLVEQGVLKPARLLPCWKCGARADAPPEFKCGSCR